MCSGQVLAFSNTQSTIALKLSLFLRIAFPCGGFHPVSGALFYNLHLSDRESEAPLVI